MDFGRPMRLFDQHFGMGLNDEDIIPSSYSPYYSRGRRLYTRQQSGVADMKCEKDKWQVWENQGLSENLTRWFRFPLTSNTFHQKNCQSKLLITSFGLKESMRKSKMSMGKNLNLKPTNVGWFITNQCLTFSTRLQLRDSTVYKEVRDTFWLSAGIGDLSS